MDEDKLKWVNDWLDAVVSGEATMSQRSRKSMAKRGVEPAALAQLAKARGVHLLQLTDDRGEVLFAASKNAFQVLA